MNFPVWCWETLQFNGEITNFWIRRSCRPWAHHCPALSYLFLIPVLSLPIYKMRELCTFHDFWGCFQLWYCMFCSYPPLFSGLESLRCQMCVCGRQAAFLKGSSVWIVNGFNQKGRILPHEDTTVSKKEGSFRKLHSRKWMELSAWSASLQKACPVIGFAEELWVLGEVAQCGLPQRKWAASLAHPARETFQLCFQQPL